MGVSDKTRAPRGPDQAKRWLAFLRNHREAIAAMDFFTVPTITFGVLYCFFIISHDRRCIPHVNVTKHPTSVWIIQQLREAFPFEASHKYMVFDRDQKFGKPETLINWLRESFSEAACDATCCRASFLPG